MVERCFRFEARLSIPAFFPHLQVPELGICGTNSHSHFACEQDGQLYTCCLLYPRPFQVQGYGSPPQGEAANLCGVSAKGREKARVLMKSQMKGGTGGGREAVNLTLGFHRALSVPLCAHAPRLLFQVCEHPLQDRRSSLCLFGGQAQDSECASLWSLRTR